MSIYSRNCYTYLIGWSHLNVWYYGAKFGKDANPDTFWINYFTSSKYVERFRKEHGDPDVIQIRKTFGEDYKKCRLHEYKVLRRLCVVKDIRFLNRSIGGGKFYIIGMTVAKSIIDGKSIGLVSLSDSRWATGEIVGIARGKTFSNKSKGIKRGTATAKDIFGNYLGFVSIYDIRWSTGEIVSTTLGLKRTDIHKEKMKLNHVDYSGKNNPFYNKKHTKESRIKIGSRDYSSISKSIILDGIEYISVSEANRILNIPRGILDRLLVSGKSHSTYNIGYVRYKINDDSLHQ